MDYLPVVAAALIVLPIGIAAKLFQISARIAGAMLGVCFSAILAILLLAQGAISF